MADYYSSITDEQAALIRNAPRFFVASVDPNLAKGPNDVGPVNLSPKGGVKLHLIDPRHVAYLDYPGSGNESARHAATGGPITLMGAALFEAENAAIVRLYGKAHSTPLADSPLADLLMQESTAALKAPRQVIEIEIEHQPAGAPGQPVHRPVQRALFRRAWCASGRRFHRHRPGRQPGGRPAGQIRAARLEWKYRGQDWSEEEVDVQRCKLGSTLEPGTCIFETPLGGSYRITAQVTDELGRQNQSQFTRWVSGGQQPPARKVELEAVTLIPDKDSYQPGDTAQILVQAPFSPAEGLLTVRRSGILYTQRFTLADGSATLQIPIEEAHIPNLVIQVDLTGSAQRLNDQGEPVTGVPSRPAYASATLDLKIPPSK